MARVKKLDTSSRKRREKPAITIEAREKQMIRLAEDLAEEQMRNKTASAAVITHYLKLGSTRAEEEAVRLRNENLLLEAKTRNLNEDKQDKEAYQAVIDAIKRYRGQTDEDDIPENL